MDPNALRRRIFAALTAPMLAAGPIAAGPLPAAADDIAAVVELFTSQGCSSCPPADALLSEVAARPDVLALSEHIDYWDHLGWKDPFSSAAATERQRDYARLFGLRFVYTPQMVINGDVQVTGSDRVKVLAALTAARAPLPLDVNIVGDAAQGLRARVSGPGEAGATADVWLFALDPEHRTAVAAGENAGRSLRNTNIVRRLAHLGTWKGGELALPLAMDGDARLQPCAVIVQDRTSGRILGADRWPGA